MDCRLPDSSLSFLLSPTVLLVSYVVGTERSKVKPIRSSQAWHPYTMYVCTYVPSYVYWLRPRALLFIYFPPQISRRDWLARLSQTRSSRNSSIHKNERRMRGGGREERSRGRENVQWALKRIKQKSSKFVVCSSILLNIQFFWRNMQLIIIK